MTKAEIKIKPKNPAKVKILILFSFCSFILFLLSKSRMLVFFEKSLITAFVDELE